MRRYFLFVTLYLTVCSLPSHACSWVGLTQDNVAEFLPKKLHYADAVIHGRAVSRSEQHSGVETAHVVVLDSYKGTGATYQLRGGPLFCGYHFEVDEERIYFVKDGAVSIVDVEPASPWLIEALKKQSR
jgi:hypothetical protein